jgi:hypothetical protein
MAGIWDIIIDQGADWRPTPLIWRNDDGTPIPLEGYTGRWLFKSDFGVAGNLAEISTAIGNLLLGATDGSIAPLLLAAQTAGFAVDYTAIKYVIGGRQVYLLGVHDFRLQSPTQEVTKLVAGRVFLFPGVTNGAA